MLGRSRPFRECVGALAAILYSFPPPSSPRVWSNRPHSLQIFHCGSCFRAWFKVIMFFIPTSPRCSFVIHALGQSPLTIFLLFSALCFLVSSYTIDNSCRNFRGYDISGYIQQAINEVQDMATYAFTGSFTENESAKHLMNSLFGTDPRRHAIVHGYFARFSVIHPDEDFYVMCDDQQVLWAPRDIYNIPPDPMGVWRDTVHSWTAQNSHFTPCDSSRKFGVSEKISLSYSMNRRYIYLCPILFDKPQGLSLAFYKDRDHLGECIDKFMILPVVLFHELLMMYTGNRKPFISLMTPYID